MRKDYQRRAWILVGVVGLLVVLLITGGPIAHQVSAMGGGSVPKGESGADESVEFGATGATGATGAQADAGCANSLKDTRGLVCVPNSLWTTILVEEERRWNRMRLERSTKTGVADYRQSMWVPTMSCPLEYRIGEVGDGGKWVCNLPRVGHSAWNPTKTDSCLVYSFGIGGKFGFETELLKLTSESGTTCEVHMFDPGASKWKAPEIKGLHIHEYGLATKGSERGAFKAYTTMLEKFGHLDRTVNLMKMDVESTEKRALPEIAQLPAEMRPQQILVELHWGRRPALTLADSILIELRRAGYVMFHMEPNYYCPNCDEFSFLQLASRTTA